MTATAALFVPPAAARTPRTEIAEHPLQKQLADAVDDEVRAWLDPDRIDALAEDLRVVRRHRVHHVGLLVCALVVSALDRHDDNGGRWLDAQDVYSEMGGPRSSKTSFRNQVRKVRRLMERLFRRAMRRLGQKVGNQELRGRLARFADLIVPDGCAFKLAQALSGYWPGTGNAAELKIHAVFRLSTGQADISMSAGRLHDNDGFKPTSWQSNALYIWDLGYNDTDRFVDAALAGAIPLQRLKSGANPVALAYYDEAGQRHELNWDASHRIRLNDACQYLVPGTGPLDMDVELRAHDGRTVVARVVCVPFEGEDRYYLTTLPRDAFSVFDVAELYRLRWEVELLFKSWKGAARLDNVHRLQHPESIEAHVWASLLAVVLGRGVAAELERLSQADSTPSEPVFKEGAGPEASGVSEPCPRVLPTGGSISPRCGPDRAQPAA